MFNMLQVPGCWIYWETAHVFDVWCKNFISSSVWTYGCRESSQGGGVISWDLTFSCGVSTFLHSMLTFESQKSWWSISKHETGCNDSDCKTSLCRVSKTTHSYCNGRHPPSAWCCYVSRLTVLPTSLPYSQGECITFPVNTLSFFEYSAS